MVCGVDRFAKEYLSVHELGGEQLEGFIHAPKNQADTHRNGDEIRACPIRGCCIKRLTS